METYKSNTKKIRKSQKQRIICINKKERNLINIKEKTISVNFNKKTWKIYITKKPIQNDEYLHYERKLNFTGKGKTVGYLNLPHTLYDFLNIDDFTHYYYEFVYIEDMPSLLVHFIVEN